MYHMNSTTLPAGPLAGVAITLALLGPAFSASAQEPLFTDAATQPSAGAVAFRQQLRYERKGTDPHTGERDGTDIIAWNSLSVGLTGTLSLNIESPIYLASIRTTTSGRTDTDSGFADLPVSLKYRFYNNDLSPIDTIRASLIAGVEVPSGDNRFSSETFDPFVGGVAMAIFGRWGFNQGLSYKFNTSGTGTHIAGDGAADALRFDSAVLYRIDPVAYTADTTAATYLTLELNGLYEMNGQSELRLSPGILYEARSYALELGVQIPVQSSVENRAKTNLAVVIGWRILF
jgi:hypothetical protein